MRYRSLLLLALFFVLACGTANIAQRPAHIAPPAIEADLANEVFFGSGDTAPATIEVRVTNNAKEPITVRRIEVGSPSMVQWGLLRQSRIFREVIEPGTTKPITFAATAQTSTTRPSEPLSFEVKVDFESGPEPTHWQQRLRVMSIRPPL